MNAQSVLRPTMVDLLCPLSVFSACFSKYSTFTSTLFFSIFPCETDYTKLFFSNRNKKKNNSKPAKFFKLNKLRSCRYASLAKALLILVYPFRLCTSRYRHNEVDAAAGFPGSAKNHYHVIFERFRLIALKYEAIIIEQDGSLPSLLLLWRLFKFFPVDASVNARGESTDDELSAWPFSASMIYIDVTG